MVTTLSQGSTRMIQIISNKVQYISIEVPKYPGLRAKGHVAHPTNPSAEPIPNYIPIVDFKADMWPTEKI